MISNPNIHIHHPSNIYQKTSLQKYFLYSTNQSTYRQAPGNRNIFVRLYSKGMHSLQSVMGNIEDIIDLGLNLLSMASHEYRSPILRSTYLQLRKLGRFITSLKSTHCRRMLMEILVKLTF